MLKNIFIALLILAVVAASSTLPVMAQITNFTSVVLSDDLTVGDDATISGDFTVVGAVTVPAGAITATGNLTLTGTLLSADVTTTDDLVVGDDATVTDALTAADVTVTDDATVTDDLTVGSDLTITPRAVITITQAVTLTPTGSYQQLTAAGAVSFGAITAGTAGDLLTLVNIGSNTITITDTGTLKLTGNLALGQYDSATLLSDGTNWIQLATANN
jgi:predicted acyltransferase (DUF342 family)